MKRLILTLVALAAVIALSAIDLTWIPGAGSARACDWGQSGGQGFVPQRRDSDNNNAYAARPPLTAEQAGKIVNEYVTRLNPDLKVGPLSDAGALYEAEIISKENEVVQILGVDKRSGQLILIN